MVSVWRLKIISMYPLVIGISDSQYVQGLDPDAQAFLTATGITDPTITLAIDALVVDLKNASIWDKMQAIWPLVGGTDTTTKYNLKDPQDTNAAYRMTWQGTGWTFSSSGVKQSDSDTTYGNTHYAQNTNNNTDGMSMGIYINAGTNGYGYDFGMYDGNDVMITAGYNSNTLYGNYSGTSYITYSGSTMPNGFFCVDNDGSTTDLYRNGVNVASGAESRSLTSSMDMYFGNRNGGGPEPTDRRYAFAFIGKSLNDTNYTDFYTVVQDFQTTLGRQV